MLHRQTVIAQTGAEAYAAATGRGVLNDLDLRTVAPALETLFDSALESEVPRKIRDVHILVDRPHVFFFREDRLNRYVLNYMTIGESSGEFKAREASQTPIDKSRSTEDVAANLLNSRELVSSEWSESVPSAPGYYTIYVDSADSLPYSDVLIERGSRLLYVGIAARSLAKRLVRQDLRHLGASTFFRSLGAVLAYRPEHGSSAHKASPNNFKFCGRDTSEIVDWIDAHVSVRLFLSPRPSQASEHQAIASLLPLLNIDHNPAKLPELISARESCRSIARGDA